MLTIVLLGLAAVLISAAVVLVSPTRQCARCHGERVTRHHWTGSIVGCPRCNGTGRHYRRGAVTVHRTYHALRAATRAELDHQRRERVAAAPAQPKE